MDCKFSMLQQAKIPSASDHNKGWKSSIYELDMVKYMEYKNIT